MAPVADRDALMVLIRSSRAASEGNGPRRIFLSNSTSAKTRGRVGMPAHRLVSAARFSALEAKISACCSAVVFRPGHTVVRTCAAVNAQCEAGSSLYDEASRR
jgi:hypothetical protein